MCFCVCVCQRREKKRGSQTLKSARVKKKKKKFFFKKNIKKNVAFRDRMRVGETILTFAVSNYVSLLFCVKSLFTKYTCTGLFRILTCCIHMCYLKCR